MCHIIISKVNNMMTRSSFRCKKSNVDAKTLNRYKISNICPREKKFYPKEKTIFY